MTGGARRTGAPELLLSYALRRPLARGLLAKGHCKYVFTMRWRGVYKDHHFTPISKPSKLFAPFVPSR
jgi:hypothetical protein